MAKVIEDSQQKFMDLWVYGQVRKRAWTSCYVATDKERQKLAENASNLLPRNSVREFFKVKDEAVEQFLCTHGVAFLEGITT